MNTLDTLRLIPEQDLSPRDQDNYVLVVTFNELHNSIEQGYDEDPKSWVDFYADAIQRARGRV